MHPDATLLFLLAMNARYALCLNVDLADITPRCAAPSIYRQRWRPIAGNIWTVIPPTQENGAEMMEHHRRLMTTSTVSLKLVLLLTTFFSAAAAQAADRKVMVEMFTATW